MPYQHNWYALSWIFTLSAVSARPRTVSSDVVNHAFTCEILPKAELIRDIPIIRSDHRWSSLTIEIWSEIRCVERCRVWVGHSNWRQSHECSSFTQRLGDSSHLPTVGATFMGDHPWQRRIRSGIAMTCDIVAVDEWIVGNCLGFARFRMSSCLRLILIIYIQCHHSLISQ